jgi:N-acetylmuramoyl-L-alanine amidase
MVYLFCFPPTQTIVVEDVAGDQSGQKTNEQTATDSIPLIFTKDATVQGMSIPLQNAIWTEHIVAENRYMAGELWIYLTLTGENDASLSFYENNHITGADIGSLTGRVEVYEGGLLLKISFPQIYEYKTTLMDNRLQVEWMTPTEVYDKIIVIDPAYGGEERGVISRGVAEKTINLEIAKLLKARLDGSDVKVYYTRLEDTHVDAVDRYNLAKRVDADFIISIGVGADEQNPEDYGISGQYNPLYFIPYFGNVELADCLTRQICIAVSGKANGLVAVNEQDLSNDLLGFSTIPAARIQVGYLTNADERLLLQSAEYQDRIAAGIEAAITKAYQQIEEIRP